MASKEEMYESVVDGIAQFTGIFAGIVVRYMTSGGNATTMAKRILRETGSVALSTAAMNMTMTSVKVIGGYLKPYIVRK
jgi:hypothetical protein